MPRLRSCNLKQNAAAAGRRPRPQGEPKAMAGVQSIPLLCSERVICANEADTEEGVVTVQTARDQNGGRRIARISVRAILLHYFAIFSVNIGRWRKQTAYS